MKKNKVLWIVWHIVLTLIVVVAFWLYRQRLYRELTGDVVDRMDRGISLSKLQAFIEEIKVKQPACRILSVEKHYWLLRVSTACIDKSYAGTEFVFTEADETGWELAESNDSPIIGISPDEMLKMFKVLCSESGESIDKRILSVTITVDRVEIKTGETNHSLGGRGSLFIFEKKAGQWTYRGRGGWIS